MKEQIFNSDNIAILISAVSLITSVILGMLSNKKAGRANEIAEEANSIAKTSMYTALNSELSSFTVYLKQIDFDFKGATATSEENAFRYGSAHCQFEVRNIAGADAQYVSLKTAEREGQTVPSLKAGESAVLECICRLKKEASSDFVQPEGLSLVWNNGIYKTVCSVNFTAVINKTEGEGLENYRLSSRDKNPCELGPPECTYSKLLKG